MYGIESLWFFHRSSTMLSSPHFSLRIFQFKLCWLLTNTWLRLNYWFMFIKQHLIPFYITQSHQSSLSITFLFIGLLIQSRLHCIWWISIWNSCTKNCEGIHQWKNKETNFCDIPNFDICWILLWNPSSLFKFCYVVLF